MVGLLFGVLVGLQVGCKDVGQEVGCVGCLSTTVISSSSLLLARIWNELLLHVCCWWIIGSCLMVVGDVMLLDVVATLGGGFSATLGAGPSTLCAVSSICIAGWFVKMLVSC